MPNILSNSKNSIYSVDKESKINVDLEQTGKILPLTDIKAVVDQYEIYKEESAKCNNYRVTLTIKPYCTNVLFNPCTEIIFNEGAYDIGDADKPQIQVITDNGTASVRSEFEDKVYGLESGLTRHYMVENTEYSSDKISGDGYTYHPGYDIFGNHLLRNLSFRTVIPSNNKNPDRDSKMEPIPLREVFNTIEDYMREQDGDEIKAYGRFTPDDESKDWKHLYDLTNTLSFEKGESTEANLTSEDGWFGFVNNSSMEVKKWDKHSGKPDTDPQNNTFSHVINNKGNCEFIDMYPDRSLFSFVPKVNKFKHRLEKNWDVFLTYPYENFYGHELVEKNGTNSLATLNVIYKNLRSGGYGVEFRTYCKHNLSSNDEITIFYTWGNDNFTVGEDTYRVSYVGDMENNKKDYYFAIDGIGLINDVFGDRILDEFYEETTPSANYTVFNHKVGVIPNPANTEPEVIRLYLYQVISNNSLTWDSSNTFDLLPADVEHGPVNCRVRMRDENGDYVFNYYVYDGNDYILQDDTFNPDNYEFGEGNTFDSKPYGYVQNDVIRVFRFVMYEKVEKWYIQKNEDGIPLDVNEIINSKLQEGVEIRFAKCVNGHNCEYYIRKFKKIPNLKYKVEDLTDEVATNKVRFDEYVENNAFKNNTMRDFMNETYQLAFSKTIYNDDVTQIQFTDTLFLDKIRDNLGRPLTDIYATIVKKNVGYKHWYDKTTPIYSDLSENDRVEFSHCFGKVTSGLEMNSEKGDIANNEILKSRSEFSDATTLNNNSENFTKSLEEWGGIHMEEDGSSDGIYENDYVFFGDVVEYNPMQAMETVLSDVQMRFNTQMREHFEDLKDYYQIFDKEIVQDDFKQGVGNNGFETKTIIGDNDYEKNENRNEGYYYKAHYQIPVRQLSGTLRQSSHFGVLLKKAYPIQADGLFIKVETLNKHGYGGGRTIYICDDKTGIWYKSSIVYVDSATSFVINPVPKDVEIYEGKPYMNWIETCELLNNKKLCLRVHNPNIPDYAKNASVNMFLWRDIIPAVESDNEELSTYPYANNALYIDKCINFFLKRQDPDKMNGLYYDGKFADVEGKIEKESNYVYIPEAENIC